MKKKLSAGDYLKPTSMTTMLKMPIIEKEEVDNFLPTPNKSTIKENIVKQKQTRQYIQTNLNLKSSDESI